MFVFFKAGPPGFFHVLTHIMAVQEQDMVDHWLVSSLSGVSHRTDISDGTHLVPHQGPTCLYYNECDGYFEPAALTFLTSSHFLSVTSEVGNTQQGEAHLSLPVQFFYGLPLLLYWDSLVRAAVRGSVYCGFYLSIEWRATKVSVQGQLHNLAGPEKN